MSEVGGTKKGEMLPKYVGCPTAKFDSVKLERFVRGLQLALILPLLRSEQFPKHPQFQRHMQYVATVACVYVV